MSSNTFGNLGIIWQWSLLSCFTVGFVVVDLGPHLFQWPGYGPDFRPPEPCQPCVAVPTQGQSGHSAGKEQVIGRFDKWGDTGITLEKSGKTIVFICFQVVYVEGVDAQGYHTHVMTRLCQDQLTELQRKGRVWEVL